MGMWSLSTVSDDGTPNMNICGYVTNISMQPKMMLIAMYHHTKTLDNAQRNRKALLQLLTTKHVDIVRTCGRQSGRQIDKISRIEKKHGIGQYKDLSYLKDAAGFMELHFTEFLEVGGDHLLGIATVESSKNLSDTPVLTAEYLRKHGIIR